MLEILLFTADEKTGMIKISMTPIHFNQCMFMKITVLNLTKMFHFMEGKILTGQGVFSIQENCPFLFGLDPQLSCAHSSLAFKVKIIIMLSISDNHEPWSLMEMHSINIVVQIFFLKSTLILSTNCIFFLTLIFTGFPLHKNSIFLSFLCLLFVLLFYFFFLLFCVLCGCACMRGIWPQNALINHTKCGWCIFLALSGNEGQPVLFEIHVVYNCCYLTCNYQEQKMKLLILLKSSKTSLICIFICLWSFTMIKEKEHKNKTALKILKPRKNLDHKISMNKPARNPEEMLVVPLCLFNGSSSFTTQETLITPWCHNCCVQLFCNKKNVSKDKCSINDWPCYWYMIFM